MATVLWLDRILVTYLDEAELQDIAAKQSRIMFYGTEERAYTDSGLWKFLPYVMTKDSHDKANPVKPLLQDNPEYAVIVFLFMLAFDDLAIPKSRQIRMSWFATAFSVWSAMTAPYREVIYQTKKEGDAFAMVSEGSKNPGGGRMDFIIQNLPEWLQDPNIAAGVGNNVGSLTFSPETPPHPGYRPWQGSKIHALPQGAHQVRQYTFSLMVSDEAAIQEEYAKAKEAANAAAKGGGKIISLSSVISGSAFNQMVLEAPDGRDPVHQVPPIIQKALGILGMKWPKGMRTWRTPSGVQVLEVHYTADPAKDPAREGAEWVKKAAEGYIGGMDSPGWKTEMEIDYNAGGGDPVFPFLTSRSHPIFTPVMNPKEVIKRMNLVAGYDHGMDSPSAFIVWGVDEKAHLHAVWELYEPCLNAAKFVDKMKACPYWKHIREIRCDPNITWKNQMQADGNKSINEQFIELGVHMLPGRRGQDVPMAMRMMSTYWADPMLPKAFVTDACPNLQKELMGLKWEKHLSAAVEQRKNNPGKIRDKNNHACDATWVILDTCPAPWVGSVKNRPDGIYMDQLLELADERQAERERPSYGITYN